MFKKRGQVTIFIILGLILAVGIGLVFVLRQPPKTEIVDVENPQAYIENCAKESMEEAIEILSLQGGDIEPLGSIDFKGKKVIYLCYNANFYMPCIPQRPLLTDHIRRQINDYVKPRVENCFKIVEKSLEGRYDVEMDENMDFTTELFPKQVVVNIKRELRLSRGEEVMEFNDFKAGLNHPIYNLAEVAMEIVNQQSSFCFFSEQGFMIFYPEYDIRKIWINDYTRLYTINEIPSKQKFVFAIKSCSMPTGL